MGGIDGSTGIYGIMGFPVSHTLSPAMHNRAFAERGLNNVYVPFAVEDVAGALQGFRVLGIRGLSVTVPYKEQVIPFLDEIDPVAARIGAVNTLVVDGKKIRGLNTDWLGANRALGEALPLAGSRVLILGAGGSARAIGFGLLEAGAGIVVASRTPERGQRLAVDLGCEWCSLEAAGAVEADALVNATSVGMAPGAEKTPMVAGSLKNFPVVMDIVYSPIETRLLKEATAAGCRVINGLEMLLYQGAAQFEIWTGREAPLEIMRRVLTDKITKK
ncbi:MAG: shikimate dehydrogenase [Proteobacteria bacterium]|nr:shikimate dehydrogenase [Pseudomonadota bacterium]MBU1736977.1 shikimate dehydrogenase [Pseudomonadota bacterium]